MGKFEVNIFDSYRDSELKSSLSPEHELLFAILERAIYDLKQEDPLIFRGAYNWITSKESYKIYSFLWCLRHLKCLHLAHIIVTKAHHTQILRRLSEEKENAQ